ncbi:hypothetical protein LZK98_16800 [Sphingomonas cannabina]|uniref:hypothetical protein n=1 Tax=Sphingomonas cannabina TaxID=2899123 RepID=UPI001F3858E9|nr:hypothetical protein [Sphingomonas cannabina]UIJ44694.1 hypothetical protein LZK98_16800 [Sphingomonas cannabina]
MRNRSVAFIILAALLLVAAVRHPTVDIRILTHDATDLAPHQVRTAIDTGVVAINLLVTWSGEHLIP